jgi:hypothetical protein
VSLIEQVTAAVTCAHFFEELVFLGAEMVR